jgi:hypothetical protein
VGNDLRRKETLRKVEIEQFDTKGKIMKTHILLVIIGSLLFVCSGCASNPNAGGEVVSSVLMGIGTGLSGL